MSDLHKDDMGQTALNEPAKAGALPVELYRDWILAKDLSRYQVVCPSDRQILLKNDNGVAEILFYGDDLVEISIVSRKDNQLRYYLHFQLKDQHHARDLFTEMDEALQKLEDEKKVKVLFSCTSGATTTFFAEKMNEAVQNMNLDYEFAAVPYGELFEEAANYDVIMLAPQIGYLFSKLKSAIPDKLVLQFPTKAFAGFNAMDTLDFLRQEIEAYSEANSESLLMEMKKEQERAEPDHKALNILSIAVIIEQQSANVYYRLYSDSNILLDEFVKIPVFSLYILEDIINHTLALGYPIDMIGLAIPGIIGENQKSYTLPSSNSRSNTTDLYHAIQKKYDIDFDITNNANAAAKGYAIQHPELHYVSYFSLPFGHANGGLGTVINGQVLYGQDGIAGEVYLYTDQMQHSNFPSQLAKTAWGQLEIVTSSLLPVLALIGPEVLLLRTPVVNNMEELRNHLANFVPERYIPRLEYVEDASNLILEGELALCQEVWKQKHPEDAENIKDRS